MPDLMGNDCPLFLIRQFTVHADNFAVIYVQCKAAFILAEGLVLLPVKVRQAAVLGEHTAGYVNLLQVERVEAVEGGDGTSSAVVGVNQLGRDGSDGATSSATDQMVYTAAEPALIRSHIICRGDLVVCCLNTATTVKAKLHQGGAGETGTAAAS